MKLPHWAQLALGLANVIIIWIVANASGLYLPAGVVTVLIAVDKAIALLSDSVPTAMAARRARLAAVKLSSILLLVPFLGCEGCTQGQVATVVPPVVDVSTCIIRVIATDVAQGKTWAQASDDAIAQCLLGHAPSDSERTAYAPIVEREWSAVEAAESTTGLTPKAIPGRSKGDK